MIKNLFALLLAVIAFAIPSSAAPPNVQRQARDGDTAVDFGMMTVDFNTTNTAGVYSLGFSYPLFSLDWSNGAGGFTAELHVCDTPNGGGGGDLSASGECTLVTALLTTNLTVESFKSKKRYIVIEITTEGTGKLTIKGSWDQISSVATDGVDVLIGGQNGVTDQANPNSPVIVCPKTNAACLYLSSTTGWWAAVSSNGESDTSWASQQEEVLLSVMIQGRADTTSRATYEADTPVKCARLRQQDYIGSGGANDWFDCTNYGYTHAPVYSNTIITRVTVTNESAWVTNTGCNFRLATTDGTALVANSEINLPPTQSSQLAANSSTSITVGATLSAGTSFQVQSEDGDNCEDGGSCLCDLGAGFFGFEVRGIPE